MMSYEMEILQRLREMMEICHLKEIRLHLKEGERNQTRGEWKTRVVD
jgi:hypothetical protein